MSMIDIVLNNVNDKFWCKNGKFHRLDGPAVEKYDQTYNQYWIDGVLYSKKEFDKKTKLIQQQLPKRHTEFTHLTDEQWYDYLNILVIK